MMEGTAKEYEFEKVNFVDLAMFPLLGRETESKSGG